MLARFAGVRFALDVLKAADKLGFEHLEQKIVGERHGSQTLVSASAGPFEIAQGVQPED
jgi:hypothetical protein